MNYLTEKIRSKLPDDLDKLLEVDPFVGACYEGNVEIVQEFLKNPALNPRFNYEGFPMMPLHVACQEGHSQVVKILLEDRRVDPNQIREKGRISALSQACLSNQPSVVKTLLRDTRIEINHSSNIGGTPFYIACQKNYVEIAQMFLNDPRLDIKINTGESPVNIVSCTGKKEVLELLMATSEEIIDFTRKIAEKPIKEWTKLDGHNEVWELINLYEDNPEAIRQKLYRKYWASCRAAYKFGLIVLICDEYLVYKLNSPTKDFLNSNMRFFKIAQKLPLELQMKLMNLSEGSAAEIIESKEMEFENIFSDFFMESQRLTSSF